MRGRRSCVETEVGVVAIVRTRTEARGTRRYPTLVRHPRTLRRAARVAATRSHGLSGSDLSPTAEAAAVHPAPPEPEVLAKPQRASEPDTLSEPVREGGDPLPPK